MATHLVSFDELEKVSHKLDEVGYRGLYWETPSKFVVEIPVVSNHGAYMGVTWRCEIPKKDIVEILERKLPQKITGEEAIRVFERSFLQVYHCVLGELGEGGKVDFSEPAQSEEPEYEEATHLG